MKRNVVWVLVVLTIVAVLSPVLAEAGRRGRSSRGWVCHVDALVINCTAGDGPAATPPGSGYVVGSRFFIALAHLAFHRADFWLGAPAPLGSPCGGAFGAAVGCAGN